jgi:hypothetical protein
MICSRRFRTGLNRAYQYFPAWLATPDEVVHHQVHVEPFMRIVPVDSISFFNSVRKSEGAIHPLAEDRELSGLICVKYRSWEGTVRAVARSGYLYYCGRSCAYQQAYLHTL